VLEFFQLCLLALLRLRAPAEIVAEDQAKDVEFRYVPAVFNERMLPLAKTYYALEELELLDRMHERVYEAIHEKHVNLADRA